MWRYGFTLLLFVGWLSCGYAAAAEAVCRPSTNRQANPALLDDYFSELKSQRDPVAASQIAERIALEWSRSGSATIDLLIGWAQQAEAKDRRQVALDLLDRAIALDPGHAEGWNRRATLNFSLNRYDKAMADIACTLMLEPRHFLAWSGMAAIYRDMDMNQQALEAYLKVLEFFPANREAQQAVSDLTEELTDSAL